MTVPILCLFCAGIGYLLGVYVGSSRQITITEVPGRMRQLGPPAYDMGQQFPILDPPPRWMAHLQDRPKDWEPLYAYRVENFWLYATHGELLPGGRLRQTSTIAHGKIERSSYVCEPGEWVRCR